MKDSERNKKEGWKLFWPIFFLIEMSYAGLVISWLAQVKERELKYLSFEIFDF